MNDDALYVERVNVALLRLRDAVKQAEAAGLIVRLRSTMTFNGDVDPRTLAAVVSRTY